MDQKEKGLRPGILTGIIFFLIVVICLIFNIHGYPILFMASLSIFSFINEARKFMSKTKTYELLDENL